jgi:23S rRNA (pseudouridine1915-N3)-methyltransferase
MKILIISPGKGHDSTVESGIAEYAKRLPKKFALEWAFPKPESVDIEGAAILKLLKEGDYVVLLDERGKDIDTPKFAALLDKQLQSGVKRLVFIIGGAFGVNDAVKKALQPDAQTFFSGISAYAGAAFANRAALPRLVRPRRRQVPPCINCY